MFILAIILSLFLVNSVYAQDYVDKYPFVSDDNQSSIQGMDVDDFSTIQTLIDDADDGAAIDLKKGTYFGNGTSININKSITINGNDAILDAQSQSGIFRISKDSNVSLLNLTLINAKENGFGSAIKNNGVLNIVDCNINSNKADYGIIHNKNSIFIYNSNFSSNSASLGGVVYNQGFLSINNSKFTSNKASDAAAIYSLSKLIISNCEFQKNEITHSYGVVYIGNGNANISNSLFKSNKGSDEGCCIFTGKKANVEVMGCEFIHNTADSYAGAIDNNGNMLVDNCSFDKNSAWGAGAIDNGGTLKLLNSNFTQNSVTKNGGAIDTKGKMQVVNCIFDSNTAGNEGGAIIFRGDANVTKSYFMNNRAAVADAIYINDVSYSLKDNWWGSDSPDYSKLFNIDVTDGLMEDENETSVNESNSTVDENQSINGTGNGTDVPVVDVGNGTDVSTNKEGNTADKNINSNLNNKYPISTNNADIPIAKSVKISSYEVHSKVRAINVIVPQLKQIKNSNLKTNINKLSEDIKLTLRINGINNLVITYINGILSFNWDNTTFWEFVMPLRGLIDRLIEKFNLAPLDIILIL